MEHITQGFKVLNSQISIGSYLAGPDTPITFLDIMVYNEISQILFFYHHFKETSRWDKYVKFVNSHSDWNEQDEIKEFKNLSEWYNKKMKVSDAMKSI